MMNVNEVNNGYDALPEVISVDSCPLIDEPVPAFHARILPLGASIVWGTGSSTGNGSVIFVELSSGTLR
jgi:hypothetical protein